MTSLERGNMLCRPFFSFFVIDFDRIHLIAKKEFDFFYCNPEVLFVNKRGEVHQEEIIKKGKS